MLTTKQKKRWICNLTVMLLSLGAAGCSCFPSSDLPEKSADHTEEILSRETTSAETDQPAISGYLNIPEICLIQTDGLPCDENDAVFSDAPVGGNPTIFFFDDTLTFWFRKYLSANMETEYYTGTLTLPDEFAEGRVFYVTRGAGSGELFVIVETVHDGENTYLSYAFFETELPSQAYVLDDLSEKRLMEMISYTGADRE